LIDEEPAKAKEAVTLLSGILRSTLMLGKQRTVPLKDELNLVRNYLQMEQIRYEERLQVVEKVDVHSLDWPVPPLVIQTIVENAIKHGISQIPEGGKVHVSIWEQDELLCVEIKNTGVLQKVKSESGIGLKNTRKRLRLMYQGAASFRIYQEDKTVIASLQIPKNLAL
jgi:two-component system, LytTR family, sensor kinase